MYRNLDRISDHPDKRLLSTLKQNNPDLAGFVEAGKLTPEVIEQYRKLLPEYRVFDLRGGMLLFTKGGIEDMTYFDIGRKSRLNIIRINFNGKIYSVFLVDIWSNPLFWRKNVIKEVYEKSLVYENVIIFGDFNTPFNSVFFDMYRKSYVNVFRAAGTGFAETWPYGIPLLEIDHVWISSKGIAPVSMVKRFIKPNDFHYAKTRLLCLENTISGKVLPLEYLRQAADFAKDHNLFYAIAGIP